MENKFAPVITSPTLSDNNPYQTYKIDRALDNAATERRLKEIEDRIDRVEKKGELAKILDTMWWWIVIPVTAYFISRRSG